MPDGGRQAAISNFLPSEGGHRPVQNARPVQSAAEAALAANGRQDGLFHGSRSRPVDSDRWILPHFFEIEIETGRLADSRKPWISL